MFKKYTTVICLLFAAHLRSQSLYFPPVAGSTWDTISASTMGWCENEITPLLNYLESKNSRAFILLKDGKIVIEKYFGTFTMDSAWYWASAGKTLTSFMVGIAQQDKFLSIADTTSKYLGKGWTNCTASQEEKITIRHQLTMTSGLDDGVADPYCTLDTCLVYKADAGTRWAYHNGPYTLLDRVIESATGQTLNNYANQKLKLATGISGIFLPSGYNNVFYSKPRSMARFGLLVLNKGKWNNTPILTDTAYYRQMVNTSQTLNHSYGYLWWLNGKQNFMVPGLQVVIPGPLNKSAPADMIAALGKNGQIINIVPSLNLVYIRMGDAPGVGEVPITFNDTIWQKLNAIMCNTNAVQKTNAGNAEPLIFPNPAADILQLRWPGQHFSYRIFDAAGRCMDAMEDCKHMATLETGKFPNGVYTIQFTSPFGQRYQKLVVRK